MRQYLSEVVSTFATSVNSNLATCVVDYAGHLQFQQGMLSQEFEEIVKEAMGWRTSSRVPKASLIARQISPLAMVEAIEKKDTEPLGRVFDEVQNKVFSKADATQILETLGRWKTKCSIERSAFSDRPEIKVVKTIVRPNGQKVPHTRDFTQLSLGQQQAILLTILLISKSKTPLIINQPEDNLDSEFI